MQAICNCARRYSVVVIGLKSIQAITLRRLLVPYPVDIQNYSGRRALRVHRLKADLVIGGRHLSHKHLQHAKAITSARVHWLRTTSARAFADDILRHFNLLA